MSDAAWPALPFDEWKHTCATLHMWTQIVGKIRLTQCPWVNHSWHSTLYVTPRGLTTGNMPHGARSFQIDFDLIADRLCIDVSDGQRAHIALHPRTTADFHREVMHTLESLGVPVTIHGRPNEVDPAIPFAEDDAHAAYDGEYARQFGRVLINVERVFQRFRAEFLGKTSPVHFFWGSFDLAVTRFSGRPAPQHPGGFPNMPDWITREAYSHEVSSAGFWPGGESSPTPIFYSYAYPTPEGFAESKVLPDAAQWLDALGEFVLPYDAVRKAANPDATLLAFLQSTYEAAADLAKWDRAALERKADPRAMAQA